MLATPIRARPLFGGLLLTLLVACGGDSPTEPDDGGSTTPPEALSITSPSVRTLQIVSVGVRGVTITAQAVDGRFGGQAIKGARLDDTTIAVIVPQVAAGEHELRFDLGAKSFTTKLQVTVAPAISDPAAYFNGILGALTADAVAIEHRLANATNGTPVADTMGLGAVAQKLRWAADSARKIINGMSAADRAAAAAYLSVNSDALGIGASAQLAGPDLALNPCASKSAAECNAYLREGWESIKARIAGCLLQTGKYAAIGALALGSVGSVFAAIGAVPGAALGAVLGGVAGAALCVNGINDDAMEKIIVPAIAHLKSAVAGSNLVAYEVTPTTTYYRVKSPKDVEVMAEFRSFIASDVSLPGTEGAIARTISESAGLWATLMQKSGLSLPGPRLPATPMVSELREMPASLLEIGTISLAGATATKAGDDTSFTVTFVNEKQGADHAFTYAVRYEPNGRPVQEVVLAGVLRPEKYVVAALEVDSVPPEMRVGQGTVKLYWTARDSTGTYLGATGVDSLLNGRKPQWTSDKPEVASVDVNGVVTAKAEGNVTITAKLEDGAQSASFTVYPNVVGSYTLVTVNGEPVPAETYRDTVWVDVVNSGTVTLNADSTFSYSVSETGYDLRTDKAWPESSTGSGTYVPRGYAIEFTILVKAGKRVNELTSGSYDNGQLSATAQGDDGSAAIVLKKN